MKILTNEIHEYAKRSVLSWLATCSKDLVPNVSPKELFYAQDDAIIIANVASPQSLKNIRVNSNVCLSFVDVLVQKGFQLKGKAEIISSDDERYDGLKEPLDEMALGKYPFSSVTRIQVEKVKPIIAPSYIFYPESKEQDMIKNACETYGVFLKENS